jgi:uncharacterized protein (TIGR03382 family)
MNNQKLMMFAVAGLLVPAADAAAEIRGGKIVTVIPSPTLDKAPVTGTPARLKKTDSEQPGNEHPSFALFGDGKTGIFFAATTELPGLNGGAPRPATRRVQLSAVPFSLVQAADGSVEVAPDITKSKFVTNNNGNEYRQAHASTAFTADNGAAVCVQYNYQPQNGGDTKLWIQCFDSTGANKLAQTEAFAKNNDDCSMAETRPQLIDSAGGVERYVRWHGCNGNGRDDGWVGVFSLTKTANGYTYKRDYDLSVIANEERSRGNCYVGTDKTVAICAGTAGNNQPQRDGAFLLAVDLTKGKFQGENQQAALLWRKQVAGRKTVAGTTTYSMRAMLQPVLAVDAAGKLTATDQFFWRHGDVQGNNNEDRKGGQYVQNELAVVKADRAGVTFVTQPSQEAVSSLLGIDGTHNVLTAVLVGAGKDVKPALFVSNGSHTGGNSTANIRAVGYDQTAGKFANLGTFSGPYADRHLYPNYLGNNPGNQGRNHIYTNFVPNPYYTPGSTADQFLVLQASTGKGTDMVAETKLAAFMTVMPVASGTPAATPGTSGSNGGQTPGTTDQPSTDGGDSSDSTLGGCSTTSTTGGLATFFLIGLAAFIRRRR